MGWKASLIIIENNDNGIDEKLILNALGMSNYEFIEETTLEECIYPNDKSINIGFFNGNIIISDDYQITTKSLERATNLDLINEEKELVKLFPKSEILTVACHSAVNYHGYSLIKNGQKVRLKVISSDDDKKEFGEKINSEIEIYEKGFQKNGKFYWTDESDGENFTEDQLMEDFTFSVAKRRLGIQLDLDGDELLFETTFKKYIPNKKDNVKEVKTKKEYKWLKFFLIFIVYYILKLVYKVYFKE